MRFKLLLFALILVPVTALSQPTFNKQTVANAGEKSTFSGGSFTWTLGEAAVGTITGTNVVVLQGFAPTILTPTPPVVGVITQPTCFLATGSVELTGLPATGIWTLTRSPGGTTTTGSGTSTTISGLTAGTYTYTVTDANALTSSASSNIVINTQPITPTAPVVGTITQPTCVLATGSVVLSGLPSPGTWTLTKYPGGTTSTGTGASTTISGLTANTYTYTVSNAAGCVSPATGNILINSQPATPTAPVVGTITQPTCVLATGSVALSGLPGSGTWTLTKYPGGTTSTGTGTSTTISGLTANTYTYTVSNAAGCVSTATGNIVINTQPSTPTAPVVGTITHPTCATATGSANLTGLPAGPWTIIRSPGGNTTTGSGTSTTITVLPAGTYTFTVANASGCTSVASGSVVINAQPTTPVAPTLGTITQPTCSVPTGSVALSGLPSSGSWTLTLYPGGTTTTGSGVTSTISGLAPGTYTFTVTNSSGCVSPASGNVVVDPVAGAPSAPIVGSITHPTCSLSTGSVSLSGLPSTGSWTLTRNPGGTITTGTGTSTVVSGIPEGTYTYSVTNSLGCTSVPSGNVVINSQPSTPAAPVVGTITQPTCALATGSVALSGLPASGSWTLTKNPGGTTTAGTGASTSISGLAAGIYTYTVTNSSSCTSPSSSSIIINAQPSTPTAPVIGTITQPTCSSATGSVNLSGLPSTGTWTITRSPGGTTTNGSGTSTNISSLPAGTYSFTVTNSSGCVSVSSGNIVINVQPSTPSAPLIGTITHPTCTVATGSVVLNGLPSSGTWTLTESPGGAQTNGSGISTPVSGLANGTYTFTVTNSEGCTSSPSGNVVINNKPVGPDAPSIGSITQPKCGVSTGSVTLSGLPSSGTWTLTRSPGGTTTTGTGANYTVSDLPPGTYSYTVTNASGCISAGSNAIVIIEADPGVIPKIKAKFNKEVLICINLNDSLVQFQWYKDGSKIDNEVLQYIVTRNKPGTYTVQSTDTQGCKNFSAGVNVNGSKSLIAFPNPASTTFALEFDEETPPDVVISIMNSKGIKVKEIHAGSMSEQAVREIPVNDLDQGTYIVKVVLNNSEQYFTTLIIVR